MKDITVSAKTMKLLFFVSILCAFFIAATHAHASWTSGGPYGGDITCLAIAPNPDVIYAGTNRGVFKSVDAGVSWTEFFLPIPVRAIQVSPKSECKVASAIVGKDEQSHVVYVGSNVGIYKSEDGGETWSLKGPFGKEIWAIAVDPANPCILFAGTFDGKIFKSPDGGEIWEEKLSEHMDWVEALLIDVDNSNYIYAGGHDHFWKSTDGGEIWEERQVGSPWSDVVYALAMTPAGYSPKAIYAVRYDGTGSMLYRSIDLGDSWEPLNETVSLRSAVTVDPNNPNVIYAGAVHKSTDGGDTWSLKQTGLPKGIKSLDGAFNLPGGWTEGIVIDPRNSAVYLGLRYGAVFKSIDGAENWNLSSHGITGKIYIYDLAIHPVSSSTVFAAVWGDGHSLAKKTNGGMTWEYLPNSATNLGAVTISPQDPQTIWAGDGLRWDSGFFVYKSTDGGQNWTHSKFLHLSPPDYTKVKDVVIKPNDLNSIIVGTDFTVIDGSIRGKGVLVRSPDGGGAWEPLVALTPELPTTTLATDPTDANVVYRGKRRSGQVFRHTDVWGDCSYTEITPPGGIGDVRDIEVDLGSQVYVAAYGGLWRRDDPGWTKLPGLPTDNITALAIDRSTTPETVYAGTGEDGVFVSQDGGSTWMPLNEGLGNLAITKLAVSFSQPKMLYAGTAYGGVWSRRINNLCEGDFEPDGDVDGSDLAVFAADFGRTDCSGDCEGDFDNDGDVDGSDLAVFAADFGRTDCPGSPGIEEYSNSGCLPGSEFDLQYSQYPGCGDDEVEVRVDGQKIHVLHKNATYNCCPDDIKVFLSVEGNLLKLMEEEILTHPCYCLCCYNVKSTVVNLPAGIYMIEYCWEDYESGPECYTVEIVVP